MAGNKIFYKTMDTAVTGPLQYLVSYQGISTQGLKLIATLNITGPEGQVGSPTEKPCYYLI